MMLLQWTLTPDLLYQAGTGILLFLLVVAAIFSLVQKDLLMAIVGTSLVSLILSVLFLLLHAPDVALTEAAIGVALTTVIFLIALRKTGRYEE